MDIRSSWVKGITRLNKIIIPLIILISVTIGCSNSSGQFAYRTVGMDSYRNMTEGIEFQADTKIDWLYRFPSVFGKKNVGVIILKHELIWVEVWKDIQTVDKLKPQVWGTIEKLEPGEYKIVVTEKNELIAETIFNVYESPDEDDDED